MKRALLLVAMLAVSCLSYAQRNQADSFVYQSYQRQYIVHVPPALDPNTAPAVVMVLHGGSGNYRSVQGFTQMNRVSNENGFLAVYPQGQGIAPPGFSWADGRGTTADDANIDDVGFLSRLIDTLYRDYAIDTDRVYVCGFSNGGFMTQRLACEIPGRFAAVGALGCSIDTSLIQRCTPGQAVPMAYVSGTADPEVPYEGGAMRNPRVTPIVPVDTAVQFWVRNNNCRQGPTVIDIPDSVPSDRSTVELWQYTDCDCAAAVYFYKIIGGGHTWPGVPIAQFPQLGATNEDLHASDALWDFFRPFSRCDTATAVRDTEPPGRCALFPNPARDRLDIQSDKPLRKAALFHAQGRKLGTYKHPPLHVHSLPPGVYFLRITFWDGTMQTLRFIKK